MIPARLGSQRIPKKNLRYIHGKPLIRYPIELALKLDVFDGVWVNTEDVGLGRAVEKMGAKFHKRPAFLADNTATNRDFTYEFLKHHECDYVVMINTTSPLVTVETARKFVEYLFKNDFDTLLSVSSERAEVFFNDKPLNFSFDKKVNSQLLEPVEKIVWSLTAWKRDKFIDLHERDKNPVFGGKIGKFDIPLDEACDIDTEEDWRIAEGIFLSRDQKRAGERYMDL
jgi:CMP-N-acetylneuraminic acid synthetase